MFPKKNFKNPLVYPKCVAYKKKSLQIYFEQKFQEILTVLQQSKKNNQIFSFDLNQKKLVVHDLLFDIENICSEGDANDERTIVNVVYTKTGKKFIVVFLSEDCITENDFAWQIACQMTIHQCKLAADVVAFGKTSVNDINVKNSFFFVQEHVGVKVQKYSAETEEIVKKAESYIEEKSCLRQIKCPLKQQTLLFNKITLKLYFSDFSRKNWTKKHINKKTTESSTVLCY